MKAEELKCTYCGTALTLESLEDKSIFCKYCGRTMQLEDSKDFAERYSELIKQGHELDLINLRKSIKTMVEERGVETSLILSRLEKLLMFLPQDTEGNYYKAFYQRKRDPHTYEEKLKNLQCGKEKEELFKHMLKAYDHRYEEGIKAFIEKSFIDDEKEKALEMLKKAKEDAEKAFQRYENIKRDVFICHSSNDREIVERVQKALEKEGIVTWVSYSNMPWDTDNYWENIENAIDKCAVFLAISSEGSMRKKDVIRELEIAEEKRKTRMELRIDRSESTLKFKEFFDGCQWVNLKDFETEEDAFLALITKFDKLQRKVKEEEKKRENKIKTNIVKKNPNQKPMKSVFQIDPLTQTNEVTEIIKRKTSLKNFDIKKNVLNKYYGNAKEVFIPVQVEEISNLAFYNCKYVKKIYIPEKCEKIGENAFFCCEELEEIRVDKTNKKYISNDGILYNVEDRKIAVFPCCNKEYKISEERLFDVKSIEDFAFACSKITDITIPNSVTFIGRCAFARCQSLTSIEIPDSVNSIGRCAFWNCVSLKRVVIPNNVIIGEENVFDACAELKEIIIEGGKAQEEKWDANWKGDCNAKIRYY